MTENLKSFCNRCNITTNHKVIFEHKVDDVGQLANNGIIEEHLIGSIHYQIIECNGCEYISFREYDFFPNLLEFDDNTKTLKSSNNRMFETFYPERMKNLLIEKKYAGIPLLIRRAYREIIDSYNFDQLLLCSAGLRAAVEAICFYYKIKSKYLKDRIEVLSKLGLISKELSEALKIHKFLGDKALHLLEIPDKEELKLAIHLLELTLETVFDIPERHNQLKKSIANRSVIK